MFLKRPRYLLLISVLLMSSASARDITQQEALQLQQQGRILALDHLLSFIQQRHPHARVLDIELEEDDGVFIYEVEVSTREGVVRELEIDASTGVILADEEDD